MKNLKTALAVLLLSGLALPASAGFSGPSKNNAAMVAEAKKRLEAEKEVNKNIAEAVAKKKAEKAAAEAEAAAQAAAEAAPVEEAPAAEAPAAEQNAE